MTPWKPGDTLYHAHLDPQGKIVVESHKVTYVGTGRMLHYKTGTRRERTGWWIDPEFAFRSRNEALEQLKSRMNEQRRLLLNDVARIGSGMLEIDRMIEEEPQG